MENLETSFVMVLTLGDGGDLLGDGGKLLGDGGDLLGDCVDLLGYGGDPRSIAGGSSKKSVAQKCPGVRDALRYQIRSFF